MASALTRSLIPAGKVLVYGGRIAAVSDQGVVHFQVDLEPPERRVVRAMALGLDVMPEADYEALSMFAAFFLLGGADFTAERDLSDGLIADRHGVPVDIVRLRRTLPDPRRPF